MHRSGYTNTENSQKTKGKKRNMPSQKGFKEPNPKASHLRFYQCRYSWTSTVCPSPLEPRVPRASSHIYKAISYHQVNFISFSRQKTQLSSTFCHHFWVISTMYHGDDLCQGSPKYSVSSILLEKSLVLIIDHHKLPSIRSMKRVLTRRHTWPGHMFINVYVYRY